MKISSEFSKFAPEYGSYNTIQNQVLKHLLGKIVKKPKQILDLGCGDGGVCKAIDWEYEHFVGVDFAPKMLELHPKSQKIECVYGDFGNEVFFETLLASKYDLITSASALQWAADLEAIFKNIKRLDAPIALAIFTANTFKTLNKTASISSMLRSADEIETLNKKYFGANFELQSYKLEFKSTREAFRYIKRSGVSGARRILSYKESKKLLNEYPLSYLEFEVVFICSCSI
ncbi:methyltransferase [Sulfurimonas sp.]|uniref:methyltransferase n=1 Tax=Sulfurimonas sp. TaxID=2022749 RepID=UPI0025CD81FE|nr:methyltransferase [Sulfurimonas sp.]